MDTVRTTNPTKIESYAIEVDGVRELENLSFVEAVGLAMGIKQKTPDRKIRVCDASEPAQTSRGEKTPIAA
jgi:hypothetical protein